MGFRVWGSGFEVSGLGFRVWGLGFRVSGFGFGGWGLGFRVWSLGLDSRVAFACCREGIRINRQARRGHPVLGETSS